MLPDISRIKLHTSHCHTLTAAPGNCPFSKGENFWGRYKEIRHNSQSKYSHYSLKLSMNCSDGIPNTEYLKLNNIIKNYQQPIKMHVLEKAIKDFSQNCMKEKSLTENKMQKSVESIQTDNKLNTHILTNKKRVSTALHTKSRVHANSLNKSRDQVNMHTPSANSRGISFYVNEPSSHIPSILHPMIEKALIANEKDMESIIRNCKKTSMPIEEDGENGHSTNKDVFHFKLDAFNDNYYFKREQSVPSNVYRIDSIRKSKEKQSIAPILARYYFEPDLIRESNASAYYNFTTESQSSDLTEPDLLTKVIRKEVTVDNKHRISLDKIQNIEEIKNSIKNKQILSQFQINSIMFEKLSSANFVVLYTILKNALHPKFNSGHAFELNSLENEEVESIISNFKTDEEITTHNNITSYDIMLIKQYDQIINNLIHGKGILGFWVTKFNEFYPTSRQGSLSLSNDKYIYMFGGYSASQCKDIWALSLQSNDSYEWKSISAGDSNMEGRYGSSGCLYKDKIYIFGGFGEYYRSVKARKSFGDFWVYDLRNNTWAQNNIESPFKPSQRAYSAYCLMDGCLFIHGGSNGISKNVSSDIRMFDIEKFSWLEIVLSNSSKSSICLEELYMHTATAVMPAWLKQRNDTLYWTHFHKWRFMPTDPLNV